MSAFLVSNKTIDIIITGLKLNQDIKNYTERKLNELGLSLHNEDALGQAMLRLNHLALNSRYSDRLPEKIDYKFANQAAIYSPIQAIKSFECFMYQCMEEGAIELPIYKTLEVIKELLISNYLHSLKEYELAQWN